MTEAATKCDPPIIISTDGDTFTQFVCDPGSFNLSHKNRVNLNNAEECDIMYKYARDYIFSVVNLRAKKIREKNAI